MMDRLRKLLEQQERDNYVEKTPEDVYNHIAEKTELTPEGVAAIGGLESNHGKFEDNFAGSSAKGIMQVMPRLAKAIRPGLEKSIKDYNTQADLASDIINLNTPTIKEIKQNAELLDHYVMYNLGKGRGKRFLEAQDTDKISDILPQEVIKSNPKLYNYKTVGEAKKALRSTLNEAKTGGIAPKIDDIYRKPQGDLDE